MEILLFILIVLFFLGFGVVILLLTKKSGGQAEAQVALAKQEQTMQELRAQLEHVRTEMKGSLEKNLEFVQRQAGHSHKIISEVTSRLEKLDATNKQVIDFTENLKNLEQVLTNPKHRGVLGEYYLESLLTNVMPAKTFQMQYKFRDGEVVDAVIFVGDKIIPVDSKFSLENYNRLRQEDDEGRRKQLEQEFKRDLKARIDETSKYIRPAENTLDFAFMFIPAEGIYYDLLVSQVGAVKVSARDLLEYAFEKRVLIVSPNSFYAYLQTVLQGLRALAIEESAKEIRQNVEKLAKHLMNFDGYMQKLGQHLGTTVSTFNTAHKELGKIDKDVIKISGTSINTEAQQLERPRVN